MVWEGLFSHGDVARAALIGLAWLVKTSDSGLLGTVKEMALDGTLPPIGCAS